MEQPVIIATGAAAPTPDPAPDPSFAAGAAAATSIAAAADAQAAEAEAGVALRVAESLEDRVARLEAENRELQAEIRGQGERFMETLGQVLEFVTEEGGEGDGNAPEVVVATDGATVDTGEGGKESKPKPDKKKRHAWWGDR